MPTTPTHGENNLGAKYTHSKPGLAKLAAVISTVLITMAAACMVFAFVLSLMGIKTMYVVSNSMVPTFSKGDLLLVSTHYNGLGVGDIIAYDFNGKKITHRVVALEDDSLVAKGDNNPLPDPLTPMSSVYGEVISTVPKAGMLFNPPAVIVLYLLGLGASYVGDWLRPRPRHAAEASIF